MSEIINFEILAGSIKPFIVALFFLVGYVATDKLQLHTAIKFFKGKKEWAVAMFSAPVFGVLIISGEDWQTVTVSYLVTSAVYDYILKHFKTLMP